MTPTETRAALARAVAAIEPAEFVARRWFGTKGRRDAGDDRRLDLAEAFDLDGGHALGVVDVPVDGGTERYLVPFCRDGGGFREARDGEGTWRALSLAMAEGRTVAALPRPGLDPSTGRPRGVEAALVCRPASALATLAPRGVDEVASFRERPLGADQSNTSVVLGERLLLKAYRRLEPGLNPDLELLAYLSEEAGFEAVPRLAGFAELIASGGATTIATLVEFLADGEDGYESTAERLAAWFAAPGEVALEFATAEAAELGRLTAGLHATLAAARIEGFEPRPATRDELRGWHDAAGRELARAIAAVDPPLRDELRAAAPAIVERLTVLEALATPPLLTRIHADLHLGQLLRLADGWAIIDFEGEPARPMAVRRRLDSPLRDVASMLRSLDHVGRSAVRRAAGRSGAGAEVAAKTVPPAAAAAATGPDRRALDPDAWLRRARERYLQAYRAGLVEGGAPIELDDDLLLAFELEKECYEFSYAAAYLPSWLWAPTEGMRGLLAMLEERP